MPDPANDSPSTPPALSSHLDADRSLAANAYRAAIAGDLPLAAYLRSRAAERKAAADRSAGTVTL